MTVSAKKHGQIIPTYPVRPAHDLPMFLENKPYQGASGRLYPIPYSDGITDEKRNVEYQVYTLENEYLQTQVLPEIGGKILRGYDKIGNYDFIYYNEVVKPALVGLAGPWISGGIEFNWPQHHRPTTFMALEAALEEHADGGKTVWTGEVEPLNRMKGMVGIAVEPGRSYIKAKVRLYNRTALPQIFMWWANLAVPVNDSYRTIFPPDVEWVNDHDRRAVLEWPLAKGVYHTARPFDYGDGTDLSRYSAVQVPSSFLVSQGQSEMDFVAGYDGDRQTGIVTVADHHIAPGKKMWHWGKGDFGDMWCSNLTDDNGPYIELMTGVYTDNQPDFTWISPYESREFEQYWYPVRDLGDVKNATIDAAMNMEQRENSLFFGFQATGVFENALIVVSNKNEVMWSERAGLSPDKTYVKTIPLDGADYNDLTVSLFAEDGKRLVSYTPYIRGQKQPIPVRTPVVRPSLSVTVEELYINGYHLEQYKQHNYDPRDYYLEGLRRDSGDIRCNTGMGRLSLKNGEFAPCVAYCDKAIARLTSRNRHPADTEALYLQGIALKYLGEYDKAYDILFQAGWNYPHRSAAYYELATIDCRHGRYAEALEKLDISLGLNKGHNKARNLQAAILRAAGRSEEAASLSRATAEDDKLDLWAKIECSHHGDNRQELQMFLDKPENLIDVVGDYMSAGLYQDALYALYLADKDYPLFRYYRMYALDRLGQDGLPEAKAAEALPTGYCFPSRLEDIAVLETAIRLYPKGAKAYYYLGNLFYDKLRVEEAAECWEQSVANDPSCAKSWRNLALFYFDKQGNGEKAAACMENALLHRPDDPRLLFEYQQLLKNRNISVDGRLAVYERYPELMEQRDDCCLDYIVLRSMKGDYQGAIDLARARRFHIYEGGEGKLTKQHAWMHVLYANALAGSGEAELAERTYLAGINMPASYGEAKTFFNQEAHIHYFLGLLLESQGRSLEARNAYAEGAIYKAATSELSLFRALALRKLDRGGEAEAVLEEMLHAAEDLIVNKDLRPYYGVGAPTPMPFEYNIEKSNLRDGHILKAYALLGYGKFQESGKAMNTARSLDPYDFRVYVYDCISDNLRESAKG
ncbi:MAG: Tetratricopeptide 2 repeat-containing protein [Paenibacillaceae bacterium]|jgi:Flp pilus assembly protein TadD|nr:Tetratricopeptide 2 repeat-containing protein [Paenibacillaceae bacterium]